jgi:hypothetical protein
MRSNKGRRGNADMAIEAVAELEHALDGFKPGDGLDRLLLMRIAMAEYQ